MTDFSLSAIRDRVHAAIRPAHDRADALLDELTDGLPAHVWMSLAANILDHEIHQLRASLS